MRIQGGFPFVYETTGVLFFCKGANAFLGRVKVRDDEATTGVLHTLEERTSRMVGIALVGGSFGRPCVSISIGMGELGPMSCCKILPR